MSFNKFMLFTLGLVVMAITTYLGEGVNAIARIFGMGQAWFYLLVLTALTRNRDF